MAQQLTTVILDGSTGQVIERELNEQELEDFNEISSNGQARIAEAEAKADARTSALAKLAALGLTEEEVAAL
jgi:hypothetical protein